MVAHVDKVFISGNLTAGETVTVTPLQQIESHRSDASVVLLVSQGKPVESGGH